MEVFQYIINGLGTYLGFNSIFLGFILLSVFLILAMRYGLTGYPLFIVFFLTTTISISGFFLTSLNLLPFSLLISAGLFSYVVWLLMNR